MNNQSEELKQNTVEEDEDDMFAGMIVEERTLFGMSAADLVGISNGTKCMPDFSIDSDSMQRSIFRCLECRKVIARSGPARIETVLKDILRDIDGATRECQTLILSPNHETAAEVEYKLKAQNVGEIKFYSHLCVKETNVQTDVEQLKSGKQIVIGTLGSITDMITRKALNTNKVKLIVVDCVELMAQNFKKQLEAFFELISFDSKVLLLLPSLPPNVLENTVLSMRDLQSIINYMKQLDVNKSQKST